MKSRKEGWREKHEWYGELERGRIRESRKCMIKSGGTYLS